MLDKRSRMRFSARSKASTLAPARPNRLRDNSTRLSRTKPTGEATRRLARFVGTQSVSTFPLYRSVRTSATRVRAAEASDFPGPEPGRKYPMVGLIDSGVNPMIRLSRSLDRGTRKSTSILPNKILSTGSFVAGLSVHGRRAEPRTIPLSRRTLEDRRCGGGPQRGLSEDQLLTVIEEAVPKYPAARVWNLSVNSVGWAVPKMNRVL